MATGASDLSELVANLAKQAEMLEAAAAMEMSRDSVEADVPVRQMLRRAGSLSKGAATLGQQRNTEALGVLSRAILENLIDLLWVQANEMNAAVFKEAAFAELARVARINLEKGKARVVNRHTGEDATPEFLDSDRFKNLKRRATVEAKAKEAGVEDLYTVFYRFMSLAMHGIECAQRDEPPENFCIVQIQGVGALARATGHAGVRWLIHRQRTDNDTLRGLLGIG